VSRAALLSIYAPLSIGRVDAVCVCFQVKFIQGHTPELVVFKQADDGSFSNIEDERIDLTLLDIPGEDLNEERLEKLHTLFQVYCYLHCRSVFFLCKRASFSLVC
jgi:hypothetical protein